MSIVKGLIVKCNSCFNTEEDFISNNMFNGISFSGNKVIDVILDVEPIATEYNLTEYEYFKDLDLSKGITLYEVQFCFATLKEAIDAANSGFVFKLGRGAIIQLTSYDIEESKDYRDLPIIQKHN